MTRGRDYRTTLRSSSVILKKSATFMLPLGTPAESFPLVSVMPVCKHPVATLGLYAFPSRGHRSQPLRWRLFWAFPTSWVGLYSGGNRLHLRLPLTSQNQASLLFFSNQIQRNQFCFCCLFFLLQLDKVFSLFYL